MTPPTTTPRLTTLRYGRVDLALHALGPRTSGPRLLLLHELGGRTRPAPPDGVSSWQGPVFGLDFTGHGSSSVPNGGGYTAEAVLGDADAALQHLGEATVVGWGLGAYVALLLAGSRPKAVRGAVLCDGRGLAGGGPDPGSPSIQRPAKTEAPPDPYALLELSRDIRPPGYAKLFARQARHLGPVDPCITVVARDRPAWLEAVVSCEGVAATDLGNALRTYEGWVPEPCIGADPG